VHGGSHDKLSVERLCACGPPRASSTEVEGGFDAGARATPVQGHRHTTTRHHHTGSRHRHGYTGSIPMPPQGIGIPLDLQEGATAAAASVMQRTPAPLGAGPAVAYRTLSESRVERLSEPSQRRFHQLMDPQQPPTDDSPVSQQIWCVRVPLARVRIRPTRM
jgi:hypothetical protein